MSDTVAIDGRATVRAELGGVERYAREVGARLVAMRPDRYRMVRPRPALGHRRGQVWEQLALPATTRRDALLLCPANLAPLAGRRNVVVIHDVAPLVGDWYRGAYTAWHSFALPRIARRARTVITVSQTGADELSEVLGLDRGQVRIASPGVSEAFTPDADSERVRAALGLGRPYVLAVGTDVPRKNFALLDRVAEPLGREGIDVVLAGSTRPYVTGSDYAVTTLGYVAEEDLPGLYAGAAAFAMPSLYEGFGMPCIEAMAAGTPVVSSNRSVLPETCGDAATLVDPTDAPAFATALLEAAQPGPAGDRLRAAGLERAAGFTWDRTARDLDEALEDALLAPR